ncbi:MAG: hypothetical protein ACT4P0_10505 [Panacagrimonas sp.]
MLAVPSLGLASTMHQAPFEPVRTYDISGHKLSAVDAGRALKWSALASDWQLADETASAFSASTSSERGQWVKVTFQHSASEIRAEYVDSRDLSFGHCILPPPWPKVIARHVDRSKQCIHRDYYTLVDQVIDRIGVSAQQLRMLD